jgi:hypothetical protein
MAPIRSPTSLTSHRISPPEKRSDETQSIIRRPLIPLARATGTAGPQSACTQPAEGVLQLPVGEGRNTRLALRMPPMFGVETPPGDNHVGQIYEVTGPGFLAYQDMTGRIANATGTKLKLVDPRLRRAARG